MLPVLLGIVALVLLVVALLTFAEEPKVTVYLQGGLGNQLFQLAAAYAYAQSHNKTLVVNHSTTTTWPRPTYFQTALDWVPNGRVSRASILREKNFDYEALPHLKGNVELVGYFQSPQYFDFCKADLLRLLQRPDLLPSQHPIVQALLARSIDASYISVHVRRGDYVGHSVHPVQPVSYYKSAWQLICARTQTDDHHAVVFSDDIEWCRNELQLGSKSTTYVDFLAHDYEELQLMALCDHHIIANSTFSWWGAYLNSSFDAITVAPAHWFSGESIPVWKNLYCQNWQVI